VGSRAKAPVDSLGMKHYHICETLFFSIICSYMTLEEFTCDPLTSFLVLNGGSAMSPGGRVIPPPPTNPALSEISYTVADFNQINPFLCHFSSQFYDNST